MARGICGDCEGMHCKSEEGEVRLLPYSNGNCILCRDCYEHEMRYRRRANEYFKEHSITSRIPMPTPMWETLKIYKGG